MGPERFTTARRPPHTHAAIEGRGKRNGSEPWGPAMTSSSNVESPDPGDTAPGDDPTIEEILETIGDSHARTILAAISEEPRSAKELSELLEYSPATVYRRLNNLEEYDLIESQTVVADDGNHYRVYRCTFDSTVIRLRDDEYTVRIFRSDNLPDRFAQVWDELSPRG